MMILLAPWRMELKSRSEGVWRFWADNFSPSWVMANGFFGATHQPSGDVIDWRIIPSPPRLIGPPSLVVSREVYQTISGKAWTLPLDADA